MDFSKIRLWSYEQQKIVLLAYANGHRINYKKQTIFKDEKSFEKSMALLVRKSIFKIEDVNYYPDYVLMARGKMLCRIPIFPL